MEPQKFVTRNVVTSGEGSHQHQMKTFCCSNLKQVAAEDKFCCIVTTEDGFCCSYLQQKWLLNTVFAAIICSNGGH